MDPIRVRIAECSSSAVVTITPMTPLQELLTMHRPPWNCQPHKRWRGKDSPDQVIFDADCRVVDLCDDPDFRPAIVQAVNLAAAVMGSIDDACAGK